MTWSTRAVAGVAASVVVACLAVGCEAPPAEADTPEARASVIGDVVRLDVASGGLERRIVEGAEVALGPSVAAIEAELGRALGDDERERVRAVLESVLGEFLTAEAWEQVVVDAYAPHFTLAELESIRAFLTSPEGAKLLSLSDRLTEQIDANTEALFDERIDAFVARVDEELAAVIDGYTVEDEP